MENHQIVTPLLTVKEVSSRLNISRQTLYSLRKEGKINAVVINDCVRFTEDELNRFIKESTESVV
jgi:excisionase family DNA binding protein